MLIWRLVLQVYLGSNTLEFSDWGELELASLTLVYSTAYIIGVETGGGGAGGHGPPIFYPRDFINIHICSADRRDRSVYYVRPPQNIIASYAYVY